MTEEIVVSILDLTKAIFGLVSASLHLTTASIGHIKTVHMETSTGVVVVEKIEVVPRRFPYVILISSPLLIGVILSQSAANRGKKRLADNIFGLTIMYGAGLCIKGLFF